MTRALLGLGGNLGDRFEGLRAAVRGVGHAVRGLGGDLIAVSTVYETPPWGDPDQPMYLNAVVLARAGLIPRGWLDLAHTLERAAERSRDPDRRFGPRTLDVDVIAVWDDDGRPVIDDDPVLTLPHPRAHQRAFVLRPWSDVDPAAELPGRGPVAALLASEPVATDLAGMRSRPELDLATEPE